MIIYYKIIKKNQNNIIFIYTNYLRPIVELFLEISKKY